MKQKLILIICLCMCILPAMVSAGTSYSGTIGQSSGWVSTTYNTTASYSTVSNIMTSLAVNDIENSANTISYVHFDYGTQHANFGAGAPNYASTPFTAYVSGTSFNASGTIGYQRNYDTAWPTPNEIAGYQYLLFDTWNVGNATGDGTVVLVYNRTLLYDITLTAASNANYQSAPSGTGGFLMIASPYFYVTQGYHTWNKNYLFENTYTATQSDDTLAISGTIGKNGYNSRGMIFDADIGSLISSEGTSTGNDYNFTIAFPKNIIIGARDAQGTIWNSTILTFSGGVTITPTPTPTSTTTAVPTTPIGPQNPIPTGYVRSMAECVDGQTSGRLHDCTVSLKDVENATWSNSTWEWGYWWIDTLPTHTIDAYGVLSGYGSVERTGQPASGTRMIELIMWPEDIPDAPSGQVNLFVIVNDYESSNTITGASVSIRDSATGITTSHTTGHSGTVQTTATNATMMYITVSKYGYDTRTVPFETSDFGPDTKRVELFKSTVTTVPTATIPPGGVTTAVTVDPAGTPDPAGGPSGYSSAKGQQMMDLLARWGPDLVLLCIMVTILGLLGIRLGR